MVRVSAAEAKRLGVDLPTASHVSRYSSGKRADLEGRYFRSMWEANYCRYLNWLVSQGVYAKWEYEVDEFEFPIKRGNRFYKPDFKVFDAVGNFEYHEVKGWMDGKSRTKLKRMAKYHPDVKIIVIDGKRYRAITKQFSWLPGWETKPSAAQERQSLLSRFGIKDDDVPHDV